MISATGSQIPSLNCPYAKHEIICRIAIRPLASQKVEPFERERKQSVGDKGICVHGNSCLRVWSVKRTADSAWNMKFSTCSCSSSHTFIEPQSNLSFHVAVQNPTLKFEGLHMTQIVNASRWRLVAFFFNKYYYFF